MLSEDSGLGETKDEEGHWVAVSDLMAGLMMVFMLISVSSNNVPSPNASVSYAGNVQPRRLTACMAAPAEPRAMHIP